MPMLGASREQSVAQTSALSGDGVFSKGSIEDRKNREEASVERAKEKKEEILWRSLRTAAAAVQIEQYFRAEPKDPSLHDIMMNVEVPVGSVDKEFLRMVSVVAERFTRQRQDVDAAMTSLIERAAAGRSQVTNQEIAQLVYKQINPKLPPNRGALQLAKRDGYFVLTVGNQSDYHDLYGEDTEEKKSGGRFHRALRITVGGREVPVIVHPGGTIFSEETSEVMIHEKQHWINESLVSLGFVESERPSLLTMPVDERRTALLKERHHRRIKDEILAYLRQGRVRDIKTTLFGDLYKHLFDVQPDDKREQEDRALVTKISDEFDRSRHILMGNDRLRTAMVYVLMGVKLRRFPEYLVSMRGLLERASRLHQMAQRDPKEGLRGVSMLPTTYRKDHEEFLDASLTVEELMQKSWQVQLGFSPQDDTRSFLALRHEIKVATAQRDSRAGAITQGDVFPPYLMRKGTDQTPDDERQLELDLRTEILDTLDSVTDSTLQKVCVMRSASEELLVIAETLKIILAKYGKIKPSVIFSVAEKGVQVHVRYQSTGQADEAAGGKTMTHVYALTRARYANFSKTPRVREWDFDDAVVIVPGQLRNPDGAAPAVRQTREITVTLESKLERHSLAHRELTQAIKAGEPRHIVLKLAHDVQQCGDEIEQALLPFYRNGTHIPDVQRVQGVDLWDEQTTSLSTAKAIEGLRNALFDIASMYPQERIDYAIDDEDADAGLDAIERVQKQLDAMIVKQLGGRQFGVGKIKNIRCSGVYPETVTGTLGARVSFEAQCQTGGFISASVDVIFYQTVL